MGGFYEEDWCTYGEDSFLWARILLAYPVYRILEPLVHFHMDCSALGFRRADPHPEPPLLTHSDQVLEECPPEYRTMLRRYLAFYRLFVGKRMVRQKSAKAGLAYLLNRVSICDLEIEFWAKYLKAVGYATFLSLRQSGSGR
jgi:hypothetical protein